MVLATSGPRRVANATATTRNVGEIERVLSAVGGGALAVAGLRKGGFAGAALALLGAELIRRGATGRCLLYETLGISTAQDGAALSTRRAPHDFAGVAATVDARGSVKVERTIRIAAPASRLYEFWRDFTNHPRFMRHLDSVQILDNGRSRWAMSVSGRHLEWESEIVTDRPDELIAWKTVGDSDVAHAGSVTFKPDAAGTIVKLVMDYEPPGGRPGHVLWNLLGVSPEQMFTEDLLRLKELMEAPAPASRG